MIPQDIKNMFNPEIKIGLTGSRRFGVHSESSDYDIYIKWSKDLENHCNQIFDTSTNCILDSNTKSIYYKRINNIDYNIILVNDFSKREALDNLINKLDKSLFKDFKKYYGCLSLKTMINFLYKVIEQDFKSTDSEIKETPSSIYWDLTF